MVLELLVRAVDVIRRRWVLILLPLAISLPIAYAILKAAPVKYVARSSIMLQAANIVPEGNSMGRISTVDQVNIIEAWLKSDQVIESLLPDFIGSNKARTPEANFIEIKKLASAISLELISSQILEVRLEGTEARGLGRRLETIVTRMLEGILKPENGILNPEQIILAHRTDTLQAAERALTDAIYRSRVGPYDVVLGKLAAIHQLKTAVGVSTLKVVESGQLPREAESIIDNAKLSGSEPFAERLVLAMKLEAERKSLGASPDIAMELEQLYEQREAAHSAYSAISQRAPYSSTRFVRVFEAPERLIVIGRPRDPIYGEKPARKYIIAGLMGFMLAVMGLVFLLETIGGRIYHASEVEDATGLPVVARLPRA